MKSIQDHPGLTLFNIVAGMHLLDKHGTTIDEIRNDGFIVDRCVFTLVEGETAETMTKSVGYTIAEMATLLQNDKPDFMLIHGDRFEVFGAGVAAAMMNIPVVHLQGGEVTGSIDESLRHAITKLAHVHFPSNRLAAENIIRMGEEPSTVHEVGCPMVDMLLNLSVSSIQDIFLDSRIQADSDISQYDPSKPYLLVMNHPVCSEVDELRVHTQSLINAVARIGLQIIWLWPNADAGSREIVNAIKNNSQLVSNDQTVSFYRSLPTELFLNILKNTACLVGNSSAGIREACYFGTPVVNIGSRQNGRLRTNNIIDVQYEEEDSYKAIDQQCKNGRYPIEQAYGHGDTGKKIADILANISFPNTQKKITY